MKRFVIGIDEVGRGALAGPVTVAAVALPRDLRLKNYDLGRLRDSKRLSAKQREAWFAYFKNHPKIAYTLARVYPRAIERLNISQAANRAAFIAYEKLVHGSWFMDKRCKVFLDGGLFLGSREKQPSHAKTVVKGDEKIKVVAVASIIAKVSRDRTMTRLSRQYLPYGFELHKGYGTKKHMAAIKKHGPSDMHRLTFLS